MPLEKKKLFLFDADFVQRLNADGKSGPGVRLIFKDENGKTVRAFDSSFEPYFYLLPSPGGIAEAKKRCEAVHAQARGGAGAFSAVKAKRIEETRILVNGEKTEVLRIVCEHPSQVPALREAFAVSGAGRVFEADIPFVRRYLYDKAIYPSSWVETEIDVATREIKSVRNAPGTEQGVDPKLRVLAFDIEVRNPRGVTDAKRDECTMISFAQQLDGKIDAAVISRDKKFSAEFVEKHKNEKEMLEAFGEAVHERSPDLLCTYNGDVFDVPFLTERAHQTKAKLFLGRSKREARTKRLGLRSVTAIPGRVHYDVFAAVSFLNTIGAIRLPRLTLERAYEEILGKKKPGFDKPGMWKVWDAGATSEVDRMAEYCKSDSIACLELALHFLPLELALSRVSGVPFADSSRATTGQLVEALLVREAFSRNEIVPNKPEGSEAARRAANPIQGAFVATPEAGVYENIAVLDFRSLYPSIIISHNVDLATLNCNCCSEKESFVSPQGHRFCAKRRGIIPETLNKVIDERVALKKKMKVLDKTSKEYSQLDARQWALKIIANSFYGYLGYSRSRWYSREAAESVTAWGRQYIQETMKKAEENGFKVLYGDSVTSDRLVVLLDENGFLHVKNIEEFFEERKSATEKFGEKEVVRANGWKCLSVNPATKKTEWKNVIEVIRHKTDKRIYRINQKFGETRVTEDHSLMADTHDGLVEIKAEQAPKFKLAQARMLPNENEVKEINVFDALKDYSQNIVYKGQTKIKNVKCDEESVWFNWMKDTKPVKVKKIIKTDTPEFESLCRLLAAYCAEGSSSTIETTSSRTGASIAGEEKWLEELKKDYEKLFSNVKISVIRSTKKKRHLHYVTEDGSEKTTDYEDHTHKLQMMNALSAVFFKMFCGQKSTGKKLPEFIYNVPNEYKRIFLNKLLEGDGSRSVNKRLGYSDEYKKKNFSYTTQSTALVSGLSVLLRQLGINHSIHYREKKTAYAIKTSDKYNERVKTRITQEKYVGWVYDLSVEDNHTFVDACGQIVLHNTDSLMLLYPKGGEEKVKEFQKSVNATLPEKMELELEDFYPRGIFVAKKQEGGKGERGAKKKYALINREGKIKIRGFELVRRDWSRIARNTQREVLRILLSEGDVRKAVELVRETIAKLKAGEVPLEECVVYTQLQKSTASYEIKSPELSAVLHGRKAGLSIPEGSVVAYVITKKGNSISEKAQVAELARDYDADYYINNQIMPAVLKILGALGVDAGDIKTKGTQSKLGGW